MMQPYSTTVPTNSLARQPISIIFVANGAAWSVNSKPGGKMNLFARRICDEGQWIQ
jgi:hypothetical protein